jgi:cell division protein FtsI/penicillin-binding protein 2
MKILLAAFAIFGGMLIIRLIHIQVGQYEQYSNIAKSASLTPLKPIPANRGRLLARGPGGDGTVELVSNEPCFELAVFYPVMDPDRWWVEEQYKIYRRKIRREKNNPKLKIPEKDLEAILKHDLEEFWRNLAEITGKPLRELWNIRDNTVNIIRPRVEHVHAIQEGVNYPILEQRMYYPLIPDMDETEAIDLRERLGHLTWAQVRPSTRRLYRRGDTLCHLLGRTVRIPGSLSKTFRILDADYLPGEVEGQNGLELICDRMLRGKRGWLELNENKETVVEPEDGEDVVLTIDVALQEYIQHRLKEQVRELQPYSTGAAAVVIDVKNWNLLAIASVPTFEPADYIKDFSKMAADYKHLPLINRALWGRYAPGSIVKPIVGAYAVSKNYVTPFQTFLCKGYLSENLKRFKCWLPSGHGPQDMIHAIKNSCDIYYYHIGESITAEGISDFYHQIGFGSSVPIGIDFDTDSPLRISNSAGRVPSQAWFISHHGRGMSVGDARNLAIGQGDLEITPLQAAIMTAAVATGRYQPPRLIVGQALPPGYSIGINNYALQLARTGMVKVLNDQDGTGHKWGYSEQLTVTAAGKTGSAQAPGRSIEWEVTYPDPDTGMMVKKTVTDLRKFLENAPAPRKEISWRTTKSFPELLEKDKIDPQSGRKNSLAHAWFIGYAPADHPRIAIAVLIEYGMAGGKGAGPAFKDIMLMCQDLGYIGDRQKINKNNWIINKIDVIR